MTTDGVLYVTDGGDGSIDAGKDAAMDGGDPDDGGEPLD